MQLPKATTVLPREKPVPAARQPTRWEQYAQAKGIQKRKKTRLVWDEVSQSWKPRYGYRRAENDRQRDWMHVVPDNKGRGFGNTLASVYSIRIALSMQIPTPTRSAKRRQRNESA